MDILSVIFWLAVGAFLVWGGFWVIDKGIPANPNGQPNKIVKAIFAVLVLVAIVVLLFDRGAVALPVIQLPRR